MRSRSLSLSLPLGLCLVLLLLLSLFTSSVAASVYDLPLECAGRKGGKSDEACQQPLKEVTSVLPGQFYVAKLPCVGCPVIQPPEGKKKGEVLENELVRSDSICTYYHQRLADTCSTFAVLQYLPVTRQPHPLPK
jgi:hypothetical protein